MSNIVRPLSTPPAVREHERALTAIELSAERSIARLHAIAQITYVAMGEATLLDRAKIEWALLSPTASGALELLCNTGVLRMAAELQNPVHR